MEDLQDAIETQDQADILVFRNDIYHAIDLIAGNLKAEIADEVPVFLCVMKGGLMFTAELMKHLQTPLELDYVHVDRYRNTTRGDNLHWHKKPHTDLSNRLVVLIDDIFDEGYTLQELISYCKAEGAGKVLSVVLLKKILEKRHINIEPDFVGLEIEDRYVFGWGMDYKGFWRNLSDVYAVSKE